MDSMSDPTELLKPTKTTHHYNEEDVKAEAVEQAVSWIKGEGEKPQTNNLDAVCRIVRALELCGVS